MRDVTAELMGDPQASERRNPTQDEINGRKFVTHEYKVRIHRVRSIIPTASIPTAAKIASTIKIGQAHAGLTLEKSGRIKTLMTKSGMICFRTRQSDGRWTVRRLR